MTTVGVLWPTKEEYDLAIANWSETVWDAEIRSGTLAYDKMGICRFGGANLYVCIYKIGNWMVRCFCSNPPKQIPADIKERYMAIDRFFRTHAHRVSALVPVTYLEQGITVGRRVLPIVKMPFLAGCPSLGEFLLDAHEDQTTMQRLCDAWWRMIGELETAPMAHGDLDLTNVLVEQRGTNLTLKLIDYDNTWIPELAGRAQTEYGHPHFQHPNFLPPRQRPYNAEMDRFSALVIYISLKALVTHPHLYDDWGADESERLLLSESDYQHADLIDSRIMQLRNLHIPDLYPYIDELSASLRQGRMPRNLYDIARGVQAPHLSPLSSSQPVQMQRPAGLQSPQAPARAIWKDKVYNPNMVFTSSPQSQQPLYGGMPPAASVAPATPWRPLGPYQYTDGDAGRLSTPPTGIQGVQHAQSTQLPGSNWHSGASGPSPIPGPPLQLWNTRGSVNQVPMQPQAWSVNGLDLPKAPVPPQMPHPGGVWMPGTPQAPPPAWESAPPISMSSPLPTDEEDGPVLPLAGGQKSTGRKGRVLALVVICLLILIILAASIALTVLITTGHYTVNTAPFMGAQSWLIIQGGAYVSIYI